MNFIAIDFETANYKKTSACSIGIIVVENNKVVDRQHHLIQPLPNYYNAMNVEVHGITHDMTENAPTFDKVWENLAPLLTKYPLLAHNASFDMTVLRETLIAYQVPLPEIHYFCSLILSRKAFPGLGSYGLGALSEHFDIKLNHHNAESDAHAAAIIVLKMLEKHALNSLEELTNKFQTKIGKINTNGTFNNFGNGRPIKKKKTYDFAYPSNPNPNHRFFNKQVVFTGKLKDMNRKKAMQKVISLGGKVMPDTITPQTDFVIVADNNTKKLEKSAKSSKLKMVEKLQDQGYPIFIMGENEFHLTIDE